MARNVNLFMSNLSSTGQIVQVDQYEVELTAQWIGNDGQSHERTETVRFPNILAQMSNPWLKEHLTNLLIAASRELWGID